MTGSRPVTPRVLILGWGFLGGAIGERLLADGMTVTGLTRSQTWRTEAARAAGARILVGDAHQAAVLDSALRDVDHVVYSIGGHTPGGAAAHAAEAALAMLLPLIAVLEALRERPHVSLHLHVIGWCRVRQSGRASGPRNGRSATNLTLWSITSRRRGVRPNVGAAIRVVAADCSLL